MVQPRPPPSDPCFKSTASGCTSTVVACEPLLSLVTGCMLCLLCDAVYAVSWDPELLQRALLLESSPSCPARVSPLSCALSASSDPAQCELWDGFKVEGIALASGHSEDAEGAEGASGTGATKSPSKGNGTRKERRLKEVAARASIDACCSLAGELLCRGGMCQSKGQSSDDGNVSSCT